MVYGSHDPYGKWVNGRPKYWACLPDPGASQNMTIKYLSVGQMSRFIYQQIALDVLFQMRYNSLPNSNKQPNDSLRAEATPCFHLTPVLLFSVVLLPVFGSVALGSANIPLHFGLSLSHSLEYIKLQYLMWKRTQIPYIWPQIQNVY